MERVLLDPRDLRELLDAGRPLALLDVRWRLTGPPTRRDYEAGHLPGAVFVDLDTDLADPPGLRGRHPLPGVDRFGAAMRRAGVGAGRRVVCYDERGGTSAARCWWLLTYFGHPDVVVLDGGFAAWVEQGGRLDTVEPDPVPGDFRPRPGSLDLLDADGAARMAHGGLLLDARAPERYRGDTEPIDPVAGHIPGARSVPAVGNVGPDGRFLDAGALRTRFAERGINPGSAVGVYCGSGIVAAHQVLALRLAGIRAALYPGSWSEWIADPQRPVATGPDPG
ncbi:MAG TPA: sulfurtransferase [Mycobacteriales bacterium]|nr:sulfurtransferase [Mycobacteriales bacterium]